MNAHGHTIGTDYVRSPLALFEEAVTLADDLQRLGFSPNVIVFELCRHHGWDRTDATRILSEATTR